MKKRSTLPLIASLCLAFLLLATPPALWNRASAGSFPGIMYPTGPAPAAITSDFGPPAHPIARAPVHPGSRAPLPVLSSAEGHLRSGACPELCRRAPRPSYRRTLTCKRPATDPPPVFNGCTEYEPVAPPDEPIPAPCIASARYQETEEYGEPLIQLQIKVDHPEICDNYSGTIELERYGYGLGNWSLSDISAEASCAKDEGPLAWAVLEILNTCRLDDAVGGTPPDIYTEPLPAEFLQVLAEAGDCDFNITTSTFQSPFSTFQSPFSILQRTPSSTETP